VPLSLRHVVVGPFVQNAYLAWCPRAKEGVIVDAGWEPGRILAMAAEEEVRVVAVVATHGHIDHVWGAAEVCRAAKAPFRMHRADLYWLEALDRQAAMFGLEPPPGTPSLDGEIGDGEVIRFGGCALTAIHTPGHTPGSVCLHDGAGNLLTGDTLFQGSIGRTDFPGGDFGAIVRSIRERLFALPPATEVHPGHGPGTTLAEERRANPFVGDRAGAAGPADGLYGVM